MFILRKHANGSVHIIVIAIGLVNSLQRSVNKIFFPKEEATARGQAYRYTMHVCMQ
jgi:hypothetical protein